MKANASTFFLLLLSSLAIAQQKLQVEAREWSRDSARNIVIGNWKMFPAQQISDLPGFKPKDVKLTKYGGNKKTRFKSTGFFRIEKKVKRWWIVDPEGAGFVTMAVTSTRQGRSPNNEKSFAEKYGDEMVWMNETAGIFQKYGFNGTGSWSEIEVIRKYNQNATKPIVYTTQLSLLTSFQQQVKRNATDRRITSILNLVFDKEFPIFCRERVETFVKEIKNDANLLGHFSDNEIPLLISEVNQISEADETDPSWPVIKAWLKNKSWGSSIKDLNNSQKQELIGFISGEYYRIVAEAIKSVDPNHLYLGSRIHSSAKNNSFLFNEAGKYVDIMSINYYGYWSVTEKHLGDWTKWMDKPFFITEFYTKGDDTGMKNNSGAGWIVRTQKDRGLHYQNFCLGLLKNRNCVGWHWFRYQDNDPNDPTADPSNQDSNKGIVDTRYVPYIQLLELMKEINSQAYSIISYFDKKG